MGAGARASMNIESQDGQFNVTPPSCHCEGGGICNIREEAAAQAAAPETDHPAPNAAAQEPQDAEPIDDAVARSAARTLVSGAINAAKASALDEDLSASLRICTLDGVAADGGIDDAELEDRLAAAETLEVPLQPSAGKGK